MTASIRITGDHVAQVPRCDECDRTIWCTEVYDGAYVFCSTDCRDRAHDSARDNVACTETGARLAFDPLPAPAMARLGTQEPYVASVPSSTPARPAPVDEKQLDSGGDLSRRVSSALTPGALP
jgi:hypothetical protein